MIVPGAACTILLDVDMRSSKGKADREVCEVGYFSLLTNKNLLIRKLNQTTCGRSFP